MLGTNILELDEDELAAWRSAHIGYVFQTFNLIPVLTAFENVEMPLLLTRLSKRQRRKQVETVLRLVGLQDRMDHYPRQLSRGQEQRVAIARALVSDPDLILADEPTGDLDARSASEVLKLLERLNRELKKTIILLTHDPHAAEHASVIFHLEKGAIVEQETVPGMRSGQIECDPQTEPLPCHVTYSHLSLLTVCNIIRSLASEKA